MMTAGQNQDRLMNTNWWWRLWCIRACGALPIV